MKFAEIILRELGETKKGYDWRLVDSSDRDRIYEFETENHKYRVSVSNSKLSPEWLYITFDSENTDGAMFTATDEGNQFRVMATILDIARNTWRNRDSFLYSEELKGFEFDAGRQRTMLYKKFIKTQFPGAEISGGKAGEIRVRLV